jgi:type I protein arginine methyltransferase
MERRAVHYDRRQAERASYRDKNILAILLETRSTIDWHNQYLIVPIETEYQVRPGDYVRVSFDYAAGDPLSSFRPVLSV